MDTLRPERDELDRFKDRRKKSTGPSATPTKNSVSKNTSVVSKKSSPLIVLLLILLVCVSSALAWVYLGQQNQLVSLKKELNDAVSFIGQSKLLLARLEGELSETGEAVQQSGTAAKSKLDFLDSEMRKLWGITNDRNKKLIKSNASAVVVLEEKFIDLISRQKKLAADSKTKRSGIEKSLAQLGSRVSATASEVVISRVELEEDFSSLKLDVAGLQKVSKVVSENEKSVASIDASRRQLNERVVELERKLNTLQLQLNDSVKTDIVQ